MQHDNPAARLLAILEYGMKQNRGKNCRSTWALILKTGENESLLMSRLGKVMALPEEIYEKIKINFPNQLEAYKYLSNMVNTGFKRQDLAGNWLTFMKPNLVVMF